MAARSVKKMEIDEVCTKVFSSAFTKGWLYAYTKELTNARIMEKHS